MSEGVAHQKAASSAARAAACDVYGIGTLVDGGYISKAMAGAVAEHVQQRGVTPLEAMDELGLWTLDGARDRYYAEQRDEQRVLRRFAWPYHRKCGGRGHWMRNGDIVGCECAEKRMRRHLEKHGEL